MVMSRRLPVVLLAAGAWGWPSGQPPECELPKQRNFAGVNVAKLQHSPGHYFTVPSLRFEGFEYIFNICGGVDSYFDGSEPMIIKRNASAPHRMGSLEPGSTIMGYWKAPIGSTGGGVTQQSDGHFEWDDHGQTPNPEKTRSRYVLFGSSPSYSIIKLWCSGHTGNPDSLVLYELDNAITLILQSDAACGIDTSTHRIEEGMSKGGIWLLVTVPLLVAVYFLVGCIINHRRGIRGVNKIPHADLWFGWPSLVSDGCGFSLAATGGFGSWCGSCWGRCRRQDSAWLSDPAYVPLTSTDTLTKTYSGMAGADDA